MTGRRGSNDAKALVGSAVRCPHDEGREGGDVAPDIQAQRCSSVEQADAAVGAHDPALRGAAVGVRQDHAAALLNLFAVENQLRGDVGDNAVVAHGEELPPACSGGVVGQHQPLRQRTVNVASAFGLYKEQRRGSRTCGGAKGWKAGFGSN